jgi:hypothetical protein
LYDLGTSLVRLSERSVQHAATAQVSYVAADLLSAILTSLVRIRGAQSYLFSSLLQKSESILGLDAVPPVMNLDLPLNLDCNNRLEEWATALVSPATADKREAAADYIEHQPSDRSCGISQGV